MMLVSPIDGYQRWAPAYDESLNPLIALEERYLTEWLPPAKRSIDVCCGTGRWNARLGGVGIDLSLDMLAQNKSRNIVCGDVLGLPFANGIADLVLCSLSLAYMWPARAAVEEMLRIARPGGTVIVTDMHPEAIRQGWKHSFRSEGVVYEIENRPYRLDELPPVEETRELYFGEPERPIFEQAGKADYFEEACRFPAVWMLKWRVQ